MTRLPILLLLALVAFASAARAQSPLRVLYHADLDGSFAVPDCGGGAPTATDFSHLVAALTSAREQAGPEAATLVLFGGNALGPELFARAVLEAEGPAGAETLVGLLARAGYDALALGHHDLGASRATLGRYVEAARARGLPVVATNLGCPGAPGFCARFSRELVLERAGARVGIVATVSPLVWAGLSRERREGLTLEPPAQAVRAALARLRARGVQRVLLLAQGPRTAAGLDEQLALGRTFAGGDGPEVILAGGLGAADSGPLRLVQRDDLPPLVGSTLGTASLAVIDLPTPSTATRERSPGAPAVQVRALPTAGIGPDSASAALLGPLVRAICERHGARLGRGEVRGRVQRADWLGYLLALMRRHTGAEIALLNRDFVKSGPFPLTGRLRALDLRRAMPYEATVGRARLGGAELAARLAPALANPRLVALGLERDAAGTVTVNGRPLDPARRYTIASIPFVAAGGDDLLPADLLRLEPGTGDLRLLAERFVVEESATRDADPTIDPRTDFGPPASARPLWVGIGDLSLDLTQVSIRRQPGDVAPQLTRAEQRSLKGELVGLLRLRAPVHEADGRAQLVYGIARNQPPGQPAVSAETADLLAVSALYNFRGLRDRSLPVPRPAVPDPYARVLLESELTRPEPATRSYRHAELTATTGAIFTPISKLRLRGGPGLRRQLAAPGQRTHLLLEAGGTLDPVALLQTRLLSPRLEALVDYVFVDPAGGRTHQLKAAGRLSFPLLPLLFLTTGLDVYAATARDRGWGVAYDTTIGLRLHLDVAYQSL